MKKGYNECNTNIWAGPPGYGIVSVETVNVLKTRLDRHS